MTLVYKPLLIIQTCLVTVLAMINVNLQAKSFEIKTFSKDRFNPSLALLKCESSNSMNNLICNISYIFISRKSKKDFIQKHVKNIKRINKSVNKLKNEEVNEMCKDMLKTFGQLRASKEHRKNNRNLTDHDYKTLILGVKRASSYCKKPTKKNLIRAMTAMANTMDASECTIKYDSDPHRVTLKKIGHNKWFSNVGPIGSCKMTYAYTLEKEKNSYNLWNFKRVRTYISSNISQCKAYKTGQALEYSWQSKSVTYSCKSIKFSLF